MEQSAFDCPRCRTQVMASRKTTNHVLHLLLTMFTCGAWVIVWFLASLRCGGWRCTRCGESVGHWWD